MPLPNSASELRAIIVARVPLADSPIAGLHIETMPEDERLRAARHRGTSPDAPAYVAQVAGSPLTGIYDDHELDVFTFDVAALIITSLVRAEMQRAFGGQMLDQDLLIAPLLEYVEAPSTAGCGNVLRTVASVATRIADQIDPPAQPIVTSTPAFYGVLTRVEVGTRITVASTPTELANAQVSPDTVWIAPTPRTTYDEAYSAAQLESAVRTGPDDD